MMERRASNAPLIAPPVDAAAVAIARAAFSDWLRAEREARGISLEDVARITKIQRRTLERLEEAAFDELPADVFVRGFIRNYARVVGLDADAAIARYDDCGVTPGPAASARANAMFEPFTIDVARSGVHPPVARRHVHGTPSGGTPTTSRHEVAAVLGMATAEPVVPPPVPPVSVTSATPEMVAPSAPSSADGEPPVTADGEARAFDGDAPAPRKRRRGGKRARKRRAQDALASGEVTDGLAADAVPSEPAVVAAEADIADVDLEYDAFDITDVTPLQPIVFDIPRLKRPTPVPMTKIPTTAIPVLTIDDDDPELAAHEQDSRAADARQKERGFLPPALLEGRPARQAGLTLAVIILLILATLTLSYLMRPPGSSGEGVTRIDAPAALTAPEA